MNVTGKDILDAISEIKAQGYAHGITKGNMAETNIHFSYSPKLAEHPINAIVPREVYRKLSIINVKYNKEK